MDHLFICHTFENDVPSYSIVTLLLWCNEYDIRMWGWGRLSQTERACGAAGQRPPRHHALTEFSGLVL